MRARCALAAVMAVGAQAGVDVFTIGAIPVERTADARVHVLDEGDRLAGAVAASLPADPDLAAAAAAHLLGGELGRRLSAARAGSELARRLGVERLPAVVVDERWAVYGVRDVERAKGIVAAYRARNARPGEAGSRAAGASVPGREPLTRPYGPDAEDGSGTGSRDPDRRGAEPERHGDDARTPARSLPSGERQGRQRVGRTVRRGAQGAAER